MSEASDLRIILDRIIKRSAEKPVSANEIIRAVRAQACLADGNKWVEPPKRAIYLREDADDRAHQRAPKS